MDFRKTLEKNKSVLLTFSFKQYFLYFSYFLGQKQHELQRVNTSITTTRTNTMRYPIKYSYIIRTPSLTVQTRPCQNIGEVSRLIESTLVQLGASGHLTIEEVGTRIDDSRRFINEIRERNGEVAKQRLQKELRGKAGRPKGKVWSDEEREYRSLLRNNSLQNLTQLEGESDADYKKRKRRIISYKSFLRNKKAL